MPRVNPIQDSFNAGEYGARMLGRVSFDGYRNACALAENMLTLPQGGLSRRPGTRYIADSISSTYTSRLFPFEFSTTQAYMLEFGYGLSGAGGNNGMIRFFRNQGQITVADISASITNGYFTSDISGWSDTSTGGTATISHDATNGRLNLIGDGTETAWAEQAVTITETSTEHVLRFQVLGIAGEFVKFRVGSATGGDQFVSEIELPVGYHCYAFTPTTSPAYIQFGSTINKTVQIDNVVLLDDEPVSVLTPFPAGSLSYIRTAQTADVMYIASGASPSVPSAIPRGIGGYISSKIPPYRLVRRGHSSWGFEEILFEDGPYLNENTTSTTLTPSANTGLGINLTLSSTTGVNGGQGWLNTDVGRLVRYKKTSSWGYAIITSITSTTVAVADVLRDFEATPTAQTTWQLGAWSSTTGFPYSLTLHEQRSVWGGTDTEPQKFWLSQTADIENMQPDDGTGTVETDDAFGYTFASKSVNVIRWLSSGTDLLIGTVGGEWVVQSANGTLAYDDIDVKRHTDYGSADIQAIEAQNKTLFVQKAGRKIYEYGYSYEDNKYLGFDLTVLNDRMTFGGVTEIAYQKEQDPSVYLVRSDGQVPVLSYLPIQKVLGWSRIILGGSFSSGDAVVESIATIPGNDGSGQVQDSTGRDEVWVSVKRTINGATARYIEVFEKPFNGDEDDQEDAYYVDSCVTYDGASTSTITGLDHLEGETVKVLADGAIQTDKTVSSGSITLDTAASVVQVGLGYTHKFRTLKLAFGAQAGTAVGKKKRVHHVTLLLLETIEGGISIGCDSSNLVTPATRQVSDPMDAATPYFTGELDFTLPNDWGDDQRIYLEGDEPGPVTILAIAPEMATNEMV